MAVRTKELGRLAAYTGTAVQTVYTCPAGRTAIVKDVALWADNVVTVRLRVKRAGTSIVVWSGATTAGISHPSRAVWIVLEPGDELEYLKPAGNIAVDLVVSGTELEGVAT